MANICSVDFNMEFESSDDLEKFVKTFKRKVEDAGLRNEGVAIAENDWLFDATVENDGESNVSIGGYVKWALSYETMIEFTERLRKAGVVAFKCSYDEYGNNLFGEYEFVEGMLIETRLDESASVWERIAEGAEGSFECLENALRKDGVVKMVA